jgi:UDP-glucose 4-epimerase
MKNNVLVLGGAGFIGSNIAEKLSSDDFNVTVIDGLLPSTGGDRSNISSFVKNIVFIESRIENVSNLDSIVLQSDVIIDSMAWTSHVSAIKKPEYDLELNCLSHLHLIKLLRGKKNKKIIYLGSRGQYGNPHVGSIDENTDMIPVDIQGIHKLTCESYYRVYAKIFGFDVISLRIPNCFGKKQPIKGEDIGLVGSFIVDAIHNEEIEIYGQNRKRNLIYVDDLVEVIIGLLLCSLPGFNAFNISGYDLPIHVLAQSIVDITGTGKVVLKEMPKEIINIDVGNAHYDSSKLKILIPTQKVSDLEIALKETINYFKRNIL